MDRTRHSMPVLLCRVAALAVLGCLAPAMLVAAEPSSKSRPADAPSVIRVPGEAGWIDSGIDVRASEPLTAAADGVVVVGQLKEWGLGGSRAVAVEPEGTFFFPDEAAEMRFPLPAAAMGPAPCFCLIGRIGDGPPFYIGRKKSWLAEQSGRLMLAVNDFDLSDNGGEFRVQVSRSRSVQPIAFEEIVPATDSSGRAQPGCAAVVFYIDGLRPDVVREMCAMGHIPHIKRIFVDGGAWCANSFTAFPSDTITSNGTMWTGCFSDRHGLKGQVRFSRRTLASESYLEPLGPNRSARLLAPQGIDKLMQRTTEGSIRLVRGEEAGQRWKQSQTSGVPPLYQHLRNHGGDWSTGALPMMTEVPPLLWTRSLVRHMPYFGSQEAWKYIDDANAEYARLHLMERRSPVTIIWLPETDSVSHKQSRGQFGMTRRTIARADQMLGEIVAELEARGLMHRTYFLLISDHGHHGGRTTHLAHFDLANEVFHKTREMSADGRWVGGGLGMSVRQHRFWNRHPEDGSRDFVFIDGDSDGAARIFLPRRHFHSADWTGEPRPGDMLAYPISNTMPPVDLVSSLVATRAVHSDGSVQRPVDLVLLKLSDDSILISTGDRGRAVVHRKRDERGKWVYKYTVVQNVRANSAGAVEFDEFPQAETDPLLLLGHIPPRLIDYYLDERAWLKITAPTQYPDGVVTLTRHMLWQENLKEREKEDAPDLVVTARSGWYFGHASSPGTMHGYPLPDSMRATLFVSGPNIRQGARIDDPCRLADLTPTLLEMVGLEVDPEEFDGRPLRAIYASPGEITQTAAHPVYWEDVDLKAWSPLQYAPLDEYEHMPASINDPSSPFDLNNIVYNALSLTDLNVLSVFDDVIFPVTGGRNGRYSTARAVERVDARMRRASFRPLGEAAEALDVGQVTVGDYSLNSLGNMKRVDGTVDWVQKRGADLGRGLARPAGRTSLPGERVVHGAVDGAQAGFWEVYRFVQRVVVEVLDENILNGIENGTDRVLNQNRRQPAEVVVEPKR